MLPDEATRFHRRLYDPADLLGCGEEAQQVEGREGDGKNAQWGRKAHRH